MNSLGRPIAVVVDDDVMILMHASDILEKVGFHPIEAPNGDEAKAVVDGEGEAIDLLFTDVEMPGSTNGFALAHYVAEHWPEIEIVVASGNIRPTHGEMPDKATFIVDFR